MYLNEVPFALIVSEILISQGIKKSHFQALNMIGRTHLNSGLGLLRPNPHMLLTSHCILELNSTARSFTSCHRINHISSCNIKRAQPQQWPPGGFLTIWMQPRFHHTSVHSSVHQGHYSIPALSHSPHRPHPFSVRVLCPHTLNCGRARFRFLPCLYRSAVGRLCLFADGICNTARRAECYGAPGEGRGAMGQNNAFFFATGTTSGCPLSANATAGIFTADPAF